MRKSEPVAFAELVQTILFLAVSAGLISLTDADIMAIVHAVGPIWGGIAAAWAVFKVLKAWWVRSRVISPATNEEFNLNNRLPNDLKVRGVDTDLPSAGRRIP